MSPLPRVFERATGLVIGYDIYSRLLKDRIVFVGGYGKELTTESANMLIAQLLYLEAEDNTKDISLYINSSEGALTAGLAVYDTMRYIRSPVTTICIGVAMPFGAAILAGGTKGKRFALPQSRIVLYHHPAAGSSGQSAENAFEDREMPRSRAALAEIIARHTGRPLQKVSTDIEIDCSMSAEQAKAYGIIDEVLAGSKPPAG